MDIKNLMQRLEQIDKAQVLTESTRKVSGDYGSREHSDDTPKKYSNPFDDSAALKAHERSKKGKEVKGRAQSSDENKKKDDMDEGLNFKSSI